MAKKKIKFSKGDWTVAKDKSILYIYSQPQGLWRTICNISTHKTTHKQEKIDNAHLISASPDMYEILLELNKDLKEESENDGLSNIGKAFWDKVKKAIAKAEGKK